MVSTITKQNISITKQMHAFSLKAIIGILLLSCVVFCSPSESYASVTDGIKTPFNKIQQEQLLKLENNNNLLIERLDMLVMELEMLQLPQAQLVQELRTAEELLNKTRRELHTSLISLEDAKRSLKQTEILLDKLESQINKLKAEKKRYRVQRNIAFTCLAVTVVYSIAHK